MGKKKSNHFLYDNFFEGFSYSVNSDFKMLSETDFILKIKEFSNSIIQKNYTFIKGKKYPC